MNIIPLDDPRATDRATAGGKGANLARLAQAGFPVPTGFVVATSVCRAFLAAVPDLDARDRALPRDDAAALRTASAALRADLAAVPLPEGIAAAIMGSVRAFGPDARFAVRSSAPTEDLATAACAGQHDTWLDVPPDQVPDRVRDCFLSLWTDRAVAYRRRERLDAAPPMLAVVVQRMVPAQAAGVGFTVDPVAGDLDVLLLDARPGLGQSVVDGDGDVDHWCIARADRRVLTARVATPGGACLDDPALHALIDLMLRVEELFGWPQDIEWALAGGHIWLLQARAVTAIAPRWTRDEAAERFPNALTPLTWDFVEPAFHESLRASLALLGLPAFRGRWFATFDHHVYGDQNAVELYTRRRLVAARSFAELRAVVPQLRQRFAAVLELPAAWHRDLDQYLLELGRLAATPLDDLAPTAVWRHVCAVADHGARWFRPNIAISLAHGAVHALLRNLLELALGADAAHATFAALLGGAETRTAQVNAQVRELARLVRDDASLRDLFANHPARQLLATDALAAAPAFAQGFARLLRDHGHREFDFDASVPGWAEAPWLVLDTIRAAAGGDLPQPGERERQARRNAYAAEADVLARLPADLHFYLRELLRLCRTYTALDDLEHYETMRLQPELRRGLAVLGAQLTRRGVLAEPLDVFCARRHQLDEALARDDAAGWADLARAVRAQRASLAAARQRQPAWRPGDDGMAPPPAHGERLAGIAGSPGVAEGPVCVVHSADDFARFRPGDVLVARTTNPAWTPLFHAAAAVVAASGGPLSHGAVTARELAIPAVMAVRDALERLRDGQRVRVDGTRGLVLPAPGEAAS